MTRRRRVLAYLYMETASTDKLAKKVVMNQEKLLRASDVYKDLGHKVVLTIGSWDLLHIGHVRYLNKAKSMGDILIVGVDSDRAIKAYKGPLRPIVPEHERCEMVSYQACVDLVTVIDDVDDSGAWQLGLVRQIKPDVFVAVEDSYPQDQIDELKKYSSEVIVLPRQAEETSTSRMIQGTLKKHLIDMLSKVEEKSL